MTFYPFAMELNSMHVLVAKTVDTMIEHQCTTITHSTTIITNTKTQVRSKGYIHDTLACISYRQFVE
jgi:hypothetical protein